LYNISQVLGITIIHSLWQGLAYLFPVKGGAIYSIRAYIVKKYLLAVSSLLAITGWFAYTLVTRNTSV
jgi:bla regulator protein BlaR1